MMRAGGQVDVPVRQRGLDFVDADLARRQRVRIHLHVHGVLLAPSTCTCATPLTIEMRCAMRVSAYSSSVHSGSVVRREDEIENRLVGRVHLGERRRRRHALRQQARGLRDGGLHVHRGAVEAAVEVELERDLGRAQRVDGGHRIQAGDGRELILERRGHRRRHRLRARAGKAGGDQQRGEVDVRQIADRQRAVRDHAEQRDGRHQQAGGDGPPDECFGEVHRIS